MLHPPIDYQHICKWMRRICQIKTISTNHDSFGNYCFVSIMAHIYRYRKKCKCSQIKQDGLNRSPNISISTETNPHCHDQAHKENATCSNPKETHLSETTDCCNNGGEESVHEGNITTKFDNKGCNVDCPTNSDADCKSSTQQNAFENLDVIEIKNEDARGGCCHYFALFYQQY